jgi:esterase/lipase superfamily enzyme
MGSASHVSSIVRPLRWMVISFVCIAFGLQMAGATQAQINSQSNDLLTVAQRFEEARLAGDNTTAARLGADALAMAETTTDRSGVEPVDLLIHLGEVQARLGQDQLSLDSYQRALAMQSLALGPDHPDLVPILQSLADLYLARQRYSDAEVQFQKMLSIERAAYGDAHPNVYATLMKLRALYVAADRTADVQGTDALIKKVTTVDRSVPTTRGKAKRDRRYKQDDGFANVRVFYGTNRAPTGDTKPAQYYGTARGELDVGYLDVSIPEVHKEGELETQSRWSMITLEADPEARRRFVLLNKVTPLSKDAFVNALQRQVRSAPTRDIFLFVHGFNVSFEDAARRVAQLAYDLDFDGTPMMYSWPSQASTTAYTVDEASVGISSRKLAGFLETLVDQSGATRIHLIAHSMGNRALIESLETYLAKRAPDQRKKVFGQIVFTAPDVDRDYFLETVESLRESAARVTLYASDNDLALKTSAKIHGAPRAGQAGVSTITLPWLDTIDMSAVQADMLGHSYFAANAGAIYDLFRMLWRDDAPARRCGMVDRSTGDRRIWRFNADICKGNDLLLAGVLFKRFGADARARVNARLNAISDVAEKQEWTRILGRLDSLLTEGQ